MIRVVGAIRMSTYVDAQRCRQTCCSLDGGWNEGSSPALLSRGFGSNRAKPRCQRCYRCWWKPTDALMSNNWHQTCLRQARAVGFCERKTGFLINNQQLAGRRGKKKRNAPPLFRSFSSSWFLSCSMSLFNLAFSTISFFSSRMLAWATAAQEQPCYPSTPGLKLTTERLLN